MSPLFRNLELRICKLYHIHIQKHVQPFPYLSIDGHTRSTTSDRSTKFRVKKVHLHNVFWAYINDATQIHLTPGRFRLGAAFHPGATCSAWRRPVHSDDRRPRGEQRSRRWKPILRRGRSVRFVPGARRHEVAIPHRLFVSWFRPASLTACPPREPPPLFEQEHRNAKEPTQGRGDGELELDELGLGAGHSRQWEQGGF